ncbi:MAG: hypothetical protein OEX19_01825 [Gammaproteobacteria bacterium]|nr:hypothetical protein [Gammaproteobacteria bacterium]
MESTWINPEATLMDLYNLPHNKFGLTNNLSNDNLFVSQQKIREIAQFVGNRARKRDFSGAKLFVRAVYKDSKQGDKNWWLDSENILKLNDDFQNIGSLDISKYTDEMVEACRSYFSEFGEIHSLCALALPKNENMIGVVQVSALSSINMFLGECLERVYFPITNADWIREYTQI